MPRIQTMITNVLTLHDFKSLLLNSETFLLVNMSQSLLWKVEQLLTSVSDHLGVNESNSKTKEETLGDILVNPSESIAKRMRTCFELKCINNEAAIDELNRALLFSKSALLKHEIAYVLGQMRNKYAVRYLINVLENVDEEIIVRHECCEALGAIADVSTIKIIEKYCNDKSIELRETAELALECIKMAQNNNKIAKSKYNSVDPAPAFDGLCSMRDSFSQNVSFCVSQILMIWMN